MKNERILAHGLTVSGDTRQTGLNNNDIIIGPSGAGKTRGYVIPNILQANESMVITDTKGNLRRRCSGILEGEGYTVQDLDLTDCSGSPWGYNPLAHIRCKNGRYNEQDIITVAACLVPSSNTQEPFWDMAARMLLEGLIGYVLECLPEEEHNLLIVAQLLCAMGEKYFDEMFLELEQIDPRSFAVSRYKMFQLSAKAEKMNASIVGVLATQLSPYLFDGTKALFTNPRQVSFESLAEKKSALFLTVSDTDRSLDALVTLFYTQALQALCRYADSRADSRLPVPLRFILDDFAAGTRIQDFDKLTSVIRSREISVSLIIQSLSQLESLYGPARAKTILNNCDHMLYLGGQDVDTAAYVAKKANRPTSDVLNMPLSEAWLFTHGQAPRRVRKYVPEDHPRYRSMITPPGDTPGKTAEEPLECAG